MRKINVINNLILILVIITSIYKAYVILQHVQDWFSISSFFLFPPGIILSTFFIIPLPKGIYLIAPFIYLILAITLLLRNWKKPITKKGLIISIILLIGIFGTNSLFIGE